MTGRAVEPGVAATDRWRGIGAAAVLAGALGLVVRRPSLLLVSAIGVALLAYARAVAPPPLDLAVRRTVRTRSAEGDGSHLVRLTVENAGDATIPDLRLTDGVPPALSVVDGSPTIGTSLRPGTTAASTYAVDAREGTYEFSPVVVRGRDVAGVVERRDRIEAEDGSALESEADATLHAAPPLRASPVRHGGAATADATGEGVAFDGVREYRHGDAPGRIDWRRFARTGELATVDFREERTSTVVVAVDDRPSATVAPDADAQTAAERSLTAAAALVEALDAAGHRVGVARLGAERAWRSPGRGTAHRRELDDVLADRPPRSGARPDADLPDDAALDPDWLARRIDADAELLLLSPATDDAVVDLATRCEATGTPVTLVSPDPTDDATTGRRLARIERDRRLRTLRRRGVAVADWALGESIERATRRLGVSP